MIAVLVEHAGGVPSHASLEVLTRARALGTPVAVWLGDEPSAAAIATLATYGAEEVRVAAIGEHAHLASVAAIGLAAAATDATLVLGVSTFPTKEVLTRFATATGAGVVVDASGVQVIDGHVETTQSVFTATWTVRTRIEASVAVVALRPNSTPAAPAVTPGAATASVLSLKIAAPRERLLHRETVDEDGVPLAEAAVVVTGGRGTGGDFTLVRELAALLGAAVGATRDATDEGWISHEHMVGQTGKTVTPNLYIGCGVSGAVHHRGGMQGSGTIVAVNMDPDAPIFEIADFGIVGDLADVLPQAIAALQNR